MPDYLEYQNSIAREFKAYENRVRNLIDDASWAEEGRFKEIILMNYLRRIVPKNVSIGTGFVRNNDGEITSQVDIIVYDNTYPLLFSEGDFVICTGESVLGIIEVKTRIQARSIVNIIDTAGNNGRIIVDGRSSRQIFNGIFGTIKRSFGFSYFLTRGTESVRTESLLHFLVYNMRRVINIIGTEKLIDILQG